MINPWDRLPNERSKAYYLFCRFRDLGPTRSLRKLARVEDSDSKPLASLVNLKSYSREYQWFARARSFDASISCSGGTVWT